MGTKVITQQQLSELLHLERTIAKVKKQLKTLGTAYEALEAPVLAALLETPAGKVSDGELTVAVDWTIRRSPDYKRWIDAKHGDGTAAKILEAILPSRTPYLVIEEVS